MVFTDIYPVSDAGPTLSWIIIAYTTVAMIVLAVLSLSRARRRKRLAVEAAAMLDPSHELRRGGLREGEVLLSGVVEHADDHEVAVRVDVTQHGTENLSSGSWSYSWTEVDRKIVVKPFYLKLDGGTRVRVLAPPNVEVADELDHKVLIARDHRVLSAELIPGETLHAQGTLERGGMMKPGGESGYREAEYEWQLVPTKGRMMLSSQPLGKGLEERARFHRRYGRLAVFALVVLQVMFANFYSRAMASDEVVEVLSKEHTTYEDSDGDTQHKYTVLVAHSDGKREELEVDDSDYHRVGKGSKIAVRTGVLYGSDLGGGPSLFFMTIVGALILSNALVIMYRVRRKQTRPWFRRKVNHSGSGQLPGD